MNKLSYDEALKQLKILEAIQRTRKKAVRKFGGPVHTDLRKRVQKLVIEYKVTINLLLSVINAHKKARRLYAEVMKLNRIMIDMKELPIVVEGMLLAKENKELKRRVEYSRQVNIDRIARRDGDLNIVPIWRPFRILSYVLIILIGSQFIGSYIHG